MAFMFLGGPMPTSAAVPEGANHTSGPVAEDDMSRFQWNFWKGDLVIGGIVSIRPNGGGFNFHDIPFSATVPVEFGDAETVTGRIALAAGLSPESWETFLALEADGSEGIPGSHDLDGSYTAYNYTLFYEFRFGTYDGTERLLSYDPGEDKYSAPFSCSITFFMTADIDGDDDTTMSISASCDSAHTTPGEGYEQVGSASIDGGSTDLTGAITILLRRVEGSDALPNAVYFDSCSAILSATHLSELPA